MKVALFVEGTSGSRGKLLETIWGTHLKELLGLCELDPIVGISKKHLLAMDPENPRMSGNAEPLDVLMKRIMGRRPFEAAIVAWDLYPQWDKTGEYCRWQETLNLYRFLSTSQRLPNTWTRRAKERYDELASRERPSARSAPPRLAEGSVLALCMESMFETILVQDEVAVKRALGIRGKRPRGWPTRGWKDAAERRPDHNVLNPAILASKRVRPKLKSVKQVRGDMETHKDNWGEFLLRTLMQDEKYRKLLLDMPMMIRLAEIAGRRRH